ncbi:MAG: hypothetical protein OEN01_00695 [Candidatus Krumholzibacteria bacterium]|nr:hypothetical protein [Candidatus Krumholzibacteria bacterium]
MFRHATKIFAGCLLIVAGTVTLVPAQPPSVPRMTERILDKASYVELAKQWKEYISKNGESPEALINMGIAHEYSGQKEAAMAAARRAVEIGPDHAEALAYLGKLLAKFNQDLDTATEYLEQSIALAPDQQYALTELATIHLKRGELAKSRKVFKTVFEQRIFSRPLQDYAYNMLIGLPTGAILVTNGDWDTFPPLALQSGMGFRTDVAVVNRSLLQLSDYARAVFDTYPAIKPKGKLEMVDGPALPATLLKKMVADDDIAVHFAATVAIGALGFEPDLVLDGVGWRSYKKGRSPEASAVLFLGTYRLDSATDWSFAWDLVPNVSRMMKNYVACAIQLAQDAGVSNATKERLLDQASEIATFHDMEQMLALIESCRQGE